LGESYLNIQVTPQEISGQITMAIENLDKAIPLDTDKDKIITSEEVIAKMLLLPDYIHNRFAVITNQTRLPLRITEYKIKAGQSVSVRFIMPRRQNELKEMTIVYTVFMDTDPKHRGIMSLKHGERARSAVFTLDDHQKRIILDEAWGGLAFREFFHHGLRHIWTGIDHILFLMVLLLPAVLIRRENRWVPTDRFRPVFLSTLKIVTAFTIAHSITLSLASTGLMTIPARVVESVIAASIAFAALNNLYNFFEGRPWVFVFAFGLFHGFGFASALNRLGLSKGFLLVPLVSFNLGVEAGQLAIVLITLPFLFILSKKPYYTPLLLQGGSLLTTILALLWLVERAF